MMGRRLSNTQLGRAGTVAQPSAKASVGKVSPKPGRSAEALDKTPAKKSGKPSVMNKLSPKAPHSAKCGGGVMEKAENNVVSVSAVPAADTTRPGASVVGAEQRQLSQGTGGNGKAAGSNLDARINTDVDSRPAQGKNVTARLAVPVDGRISGGAESLSGGQESRVFKSRNDDELDRSGRFRHSFEASKGRKMEETFQDRAFRFQAEDWALLSERWGEAGRKVSKDDNKHSSRKRGLHSPSASDCSSSLFSTLDSTSSFSSRSEASSYFLKGDVSPAIVIPSQCSKLPMSAISLPPSSISQCYPEALQRIASSGHPAEEVELKVRALPQADSDLDDGSFLEFDFREGQMVETQEPPAPGSEGDTMTFECAEIRSQGTENAGEKQHGMTNYKLQPLPSYRHLEENALEDDVSASGFATPHTVFFSATTRSPESVFCSPEQRITRAASLGSDKEASEFLNANNNDWDLCRYDSDPSGADHDRRGGGNCRCASFSDTSLLKESLGLGKTSSTVFPTNADTSSKPSRAARKTLPVKGIVSARPPSSPQAATQGGLAGRKTSQPQRSQLTTISKQGPVKGTASFSDWPDDRPLLSGAADQSCKYPEQKENGFRNRRTSASPGAKRFPSPLCGSRTSPSPINRTHPSPMARASSGAALKMSGSPLGRFSSSPAVRTSSPARRNLYSSFKDSKLSHAIHDTFHPGLRGPKTEIPQQCARASMSPVRSWLDPVKESRASILASWASMNGGASEATPRASPESCTDLESDVSESRRSSKMKISLRRKENRGALATLYRAASPGVPRPRMSISGLKYNSYGEILKPLLPVLKTPGVPATKLPKVSGKLAHSLSQRVHSFVSRSSATASVQEKGGCVGGQMQCVYRDGAPSYSLVMDDTEEMFVAKIGKADPADVHNDVIFTIYRWKGKGRGKSGWRSWGKKDKPVCQYVGKLRVSSTLCDELGCSGEVMYYVESECVFVDVLEQEALSVPSILRSSQVSASVWDSTPGRSPWLHCTGSPASSTYFSPAGSASFDSTPVRRADTSSQGILGRNWFSPDQLNKVKENNALEMYKRQPEKQVWRASPLLARFENRPRKSFQDLWSDSDGTDDSEMRPSTSCQSHTELAAVVVRTPVDKDLAFLQGANLAPGEKSGWGLNFLRRRSIRPLRSSDMTSDEELCCGGPSRESDVCSDCGQCYACGSDAPEADLLKCQSHSSSGSEKGQRRKLCDLQKMEDNIIEHGKVSPGQLTVNVVLPAGTHAFCSTGVTGPQPLIQRWRSGGRCDCGNWDEGCGLTVLETKSPSIDQRQHPEHSCKIYTLGKKDQLAIDISQQGHDGLFSISFQDPMDSVQAFATAVGVLRCREPFLPVAKRADPKRKPPRCPLRPVNNGGDTNLRSSDSHGGHFLSCPLDPPLSPCSRS